MARGARDLAGARGGPVTGSPAVLPGSRADGLRALAGVQRQSAECLRIAILTALAEGLTWREIGEALGVPHETVFRQYQAGSPVSVLRPYQSEASPRAGRRADG